jgi:putative DNA primase/helicase
LTGPLNCADWSLHDLATNKYATADLYGRLLNIYPDISAAELSSSSRFRAITGGDSIQAEHKFRDAFSFRPYCRLAFSANKFPAIRDPTSALFDRWIVVPWVVRFRGTKQEDKELMEKLTRPEELSGILNLALRGLGRLLRNGSFTMPRAAERALAEFIEKADTVRLFLRDKKEDGELREGEPYLRPMLWDLYRDWCRESEHPALSKSGFNERIEQIAGREYHKNSAGHFVIEIP